MSDFDGWPRVCSVCGEKLTLTGPDSFWFETTVIGRTQELRSYHARCYPRIREASA